MLSDLHSSLSWGYWTVVSIDAEFSVGLGQGSKALVEAGRVSSTFGETGFYKFSTVTVRKFVVERNYVSGFIDDSSYLNAFLCLDLVVNVGVIKVSF